MLVAAATHALSESMNWHQQQQQHTINNFEKSKAEQ
jgi:hypothetical protein